MFKKKKKTSPAFFLHATCTGLVRLCLLPSSWCRHGFGHNREALPLHASRLGFGSLPHLFFLFYAGVLGFGFCKVESLVKIMKVERDVYAAEIDEKVAIKIGPGDYEPSSGSKKWVLAAEGNEYKVWEAP